MTDPADPRQIDRDDHDDTFDDDTFDDDTFDDDTFDDDTADDTADETIRRLSRWDRPPPPHDWRHFVGMLGRTLIVIGLLMFGFVGYQLWGTGIATARAQNRLENQFEQQIADTAGEVLDPATPTTPATTPATTPGDNTAAVPTVPTTATEPTTGEADPAPPSTVPGGTTPPVPATAPAIEQDIPPIVPGEALAKLEIPRMGKEGGSALFVVPGVDLDALQSGPGHYPDTPLPGQLGNAAIAGHRTTWGEPFARIDELQPGDEIIVTMLTGDRFVYEVASTEIVSPKDYDVVRTRDPTVAELTLTSCHPRWSARQRIVVHAFLVPAVSAPVGTPTFYDLEANDAGRDDDTGDTGDGSDDPTVTLPGGTAPEASLPGTEATSDGQDTGDGAAAGGTDGPDALTGGWFDDADAWPQIALWGAVCVAIAVLAYRVSKRFRNYAIGWSTAIAPFVVALYFLYQNINRLLPPGL